MLLLGIFWLPFGIWAISHGILWKTKRGKVKREIISFSCFTKIEDIFICVGSKDNGKH